MDYRSENIAPEYKVKERTLRIYRGELERTANLEKIREGQSYSQKTVGVARDFYEREDSYRMAA